MSIVDDLFKANEKYYQTFTAGMLPVQPARKLAIVTCMDARIDVFAILGLQPGDAHVIRNAGGIVTDDAMRSLLISHHLLGTQEFFVMNHTDCGMMRFTEEQIRSDLRKRFGTAALAPDHFYAFRELEDNVREQLEKVRTHPWMPQEIPVRGAVYDVRTGRVTEVTL